MAIFALFLAFSNQLNADCPNGSVDFYYPTWHDNHTEYNLNYVGTVNNIGCCYHFPNCNPCTDPNQTCRENFPEACGEGQCDDYNQASCSLLKKETPRKKM